MRDSSLKATNVYLTTDTKYNSINEAWDIFHKKYDKYIL